MGQGLSTNYLGDPNQPEDDLDKQFGGFLDNGMRSQAQNQFLPKPQTNQNQRQQDLIRMFSEDSPSQPPQMTQPQRPQVIPPENPQPQSFVPPNIGNPAQPIQPPAIPQAGQPQMQPMGVPQSMPDSPQQQMSQMQQPQGMDLASGAVRPDISNGASPHQMSGIPPEGVNPNEQAEEEQIKQTTQQILTNPQASLLAEHAAFSPAPANQQVSFDSPEVIAGAVKNEPDVSTAKFDKLTKAQAASTPAGALVENTLQQAIIRPNTNSDPNSPCFADNGAYTCPLTREPCGKKGFFARFFAALRLLLGIDKPEATVACIQKQRQQDPETVNYFRSQQMQQGNGIPLQNPSANPGMSSMNSYIPPTTGHSQQGM
jgi:hypothetical protein